MSSGNITTVVNGLKDTLEKLAKKITLDVTAELIKTTPVDTGWARANWVPSISEPYNIDFGSNLSRKERSSLVSDGQATQNDGAANVAANYKLSLGSLFITNNVDYIVLLNEGYSQQAPAAFVQQAISTALASNAGELK